MINFTTLFDSYYLDKALCMYRSLERVSKEFTLYIFCFDDRSKQILEKEKLPHAVLLSHRDLEKTYPILLEKKQQRSKAEYCWTCTPASIEYVLDKYPVEHCTYIDADLYFFADPAILLEEMTSEEANAAGRHTLITSHRFIDSLRDKRFLRRSGKYCVEFNYFDQSKEAREALTWWKEQCFAWCYHLYEPERMGDQKYLEKFPMLFQGVHELSHLGGGVAPWNLAQYELVEDYIPQEDLIHQEELASQGDGEESPYLCHRKNRAGMETPHLNLRENRTGKVFPLVFYHFQNIRYLSEKKVNICSGTRSKKTKDAIYLPYLREIEKTRKDLEKYGVSFAVKKIYSSNPVIAFLQGNVLRFKVRSLSDVYDLREIEKL